jgi:hypothetical protein
MIQTSGGTSQHTAYPLVSKSRRVSSGAESDQRIRRPWSAGGGVHSAVKAHTLIDSNMRTKDSTNHLDDTPKEETTQLRRCRPNRSPALGFFPCSRHG